MFGFGDALIAMPLLAMVLGLKTATPLVALVSFTIATVILFTTWRSLKFGAASRLIISTLVGIPIGIALLKGVDERIMLFLLSCVILLFSGFNLSTLAVPKLKTDRSAYLFGFIAGLLGGAYNTNGSPIVIFASMREWPPAEFRATLQGYFFVTGFMLLGAHALGGLWNERVFTLYRDRVARLFNFISNINRGHSRQEILYQSIDVESPYTSFSACPVTTGSPG